VLGALLSRPCTQDEETVLMRSLQELRSSKWTMSVHPWARVFHLRNYWMDLDYIWHWVVYSEVGKNLFWSISFTWSWCLYSTITQQLLSSLRYTFMTTCFGFYWSIFRSYITSLITLLQCYYLQIILEILQER
jgi:hypothetical protein